MTTQEMLPKTHHVLVLKRTRDPLDLTVEEQPVPDSGAGNAIVRILASPIVSYVHEVFTGKKVGYTYPEPFVPGASAVGRIAAVGPDAALLHPGQLVFVDCYVRGRDDPSTGFLSGLHDGHTAGSKKLMHGEWRHGTWAEYYKAPLENCFPLNEQRLLGSPNDGGLGYKVEELCFLGQLLVPFGGLRDVNLRVGESIIIAPATGPFGSAAVHLALALGVRRIFAMGRNTEALEKLQSIDKRVKAIPIVGDSQVETTSLRAEGPVDVFFDIAPRVASASSHFKSGILALGHHGRASLMGGQRGDVGIPIEAVTHRCLQIRGKWMYEPADVRELIRLVEAGFIKLGTKAGVTIVGKFELAEYDAALTKAAETAGPGTQTVFVP
ncbi:Fc.00g033330.m01.CDS01 [Cosmosporella sp. VM-42]